jgi:tetratricopeptide (TPR) repeat protein
MSAHQPTANDYDEKLREMGNYLFTLDQEGDFAHREGDTERVAEIEKEIARLAGLALRMLKRWEEAAQAFLDVLDENPMNGEAWLELTWCMGEQGKWDEAKMAAEKATELYPDVSAAWGNLGHVLIQLGQRKEAREVLQKAVELDPNDLRNHELLGQLSV